MLNDFVLICIVVFTVAEEDTEMLPNEEADSSFAYVTLQMKASSTCFFVELKV